MKTEEKMNKIEQIEENNGEEDKVYYDIRKFINLASQANPNIIVLSYLMGYEDSIIVKSEDWKRNNCPYQYETYYKGHCFTVCKALMFAEIISDTNFCCLKFEECDKYVKVVIEKLKI